jgi:hypothetical protein
MNTGGVKTCRDMKKIKQERKEKVGDDEKIRQKRYGKSKY